MEQNASPDFEVVWHLSDIVLGERSYQILQKAIVHLADVKKLEKILDKKLGVTIDTIEGQVNAAISSQVKSLGFVELKLDVNSVDWTTVVRGALRREAPFEQETEKGFRDALVLETVCQLADDIDKESQLYFLCGDGRLLEAAQPRLASRSNVSVVQSLEEL
jgi:hypothetical protein